MPAMKVSTNKLVKKPAAKVHSKAFEKKETKVTEKKESPKFEKFEKKMGTEKPMPFKCGGKVKGK